MWIINVAATVRAYCKHGASALPEKPSITAGNTILDQPTMGVDRNDLQVNNSTDRLLLFALPGKKVRKKKIDNVGDTYILLFYSTWLGGAYVAGHNDNEAREGENSEWIRVRNGREKRIESKVC